MTSGQKKEDKKTWWWNKEGQERIWRKRLVKKKRDSNIDEESGQIYMEMWCTAKREVVEDTKKEYSEVGH